MSIIRIGKSADIEVTVSPRAAECLTSPEQIQLVDTTARMLYSILTSGCLTEANKQEFIRRSSILFSMGLVYYINDGSDKDKPRGVILHHHAARARERLANIDRIADKLFSETHK